MSDAVVSIVAQLRKWRGEQAAREGVETFRVLPNATLEELARILPQTKEELLSVKGIKEAKYRKYGAALLKIIHEQSGPSVISPETRLALGPAKQVGVETEGPWIPDQVGDDSTRKKENAEDHPLSVSQFLDGLNIELSGMAARVRGEVSSVDVRERVVYFTLKDGEDESIINCLIFRYQYQVSGVSLAVGDEIIVEGVPEIYKPSGRLSLKVGVIELAGEGALKKAYDALLRKLEGEGLMAPERKRVLPQFPERVALITSREGAAIGDFTMNLGPLGLRVDFFPVSVEGKRAVFEILEAIKFFNQHPERYDLLVVIRGGGSLESLQAFNNETLVREVASSEIPTLLGVGHEKDVTLAALVADMMVSTPTATARTIREPFEGARQSVRHAETMLMERFERGLREANHLLSRSQEALSLVFPKLKERFVRAEESLLRSFESLRFSIRAMREHFLDSRKSLLVYFDTAQHECRESLVRFEAKLREYSPDRALSLGYSLVRREGKLIKSIAMVHPGDTLDISLRDGRIEAEVKSIEEGKKI